MTAMISSSEVDSHSEVSQLNTFLFPQSRMCETLVNSQEMSTTTMDKIDEPRNEVLTLPAVTPQSNEFRGATTSSGCVSYEIPRCEMPPVAEMDAIEKFVVNAIRSQESISSPTKDELGNVNSLNPSHYEGYQAIISSFKRPTDPRLLRKLMIALRTAGNGSVLNQLVLGNTHAHLVHLIIRFNPTRPPNHYEDTFVGDHAELRLLYQSCSLCDAHFHLLLALVSAKSTLVLPILSATWKHLTRYGPIQDEMM
jgi:hypothetical protein